MKPKNKIKLLNTLDSASDIVDGIKSVIPKKPELNPLMLLGLIIFNFGIGALSNYVNLLVIWVFGFIGNLLIIILSENFGK